MWYIIQWGFIQCNLNSIWSCQKGREQRLLFSLLYCIDTVSDNVPCKRNICSFDDYSLLDTPVLKKDTIQFNNLDRSWQLNGILFKCWRGHCKAGRLEPMLGSTKGFHSVWKTKLLFFFKCYKNSCTFQSNVAVLFNNKNPFHWFCKRKVLIKPEIFRSCWTLTEQ